MAAPKTQGENCGDIAGMREQILANAKVLWPMLNMGTDDTNDSKVPVPTFSLVTGGVNTIISATVLYQIGSYDTARKFQFIVGPNAPSQGEAVERLLTMTSKLYHDHWKSNVFWLVGTKKVNVEGGGCYYEKEK